MLRGKTQDRMTRLLNCLYWLEAALLVIALIVALYG